MSIVPPVMVNVPATVPSAEELLMFNVPALRVVPPVKVFAPDSVNVPAPILVSEPVVAALAPEIVRLLVVTSMNEVVAAVNVKALFVVAVAPVYCKVPPPITKFAAAFVAAPRFPETPPLPIVATLSTPTLIVVTPVYKFVPDNVSMPLPIFVRAPVVLVLAPEIVKLFVVTSMDEVVPAVNVKFLFVEAVAPVYCNVPPPSTKFPAATAAAPRFPATPPLPIVPTLSTPALIVVIPV